MIFRNLATELGPDQPVYAVQMLEEDIAAMGSASFEDLVDFYVRLIRQMQPEGPYRLAGWCVSGWIAYGVARQLETQGAEIEMLIVIDSWAPAYWSSQSHIRRALMRTIYGIQRTLWVGRRLRQTNVAQSGTYIQRSLPGIAAAVQKVTARFSHRSLLAEMREIEDLSRNDSLERTASRAALSGPLQGKVLLFRSEEEATGPLLSPDMGWSQMLDRSVQVEALPGGHHEIFDLPGARVMAACVNEMLGTSIPPVLTLDTLRSSERKNTEVQSSAGIPLAKA
jgi:thioesterase domain-containing protein